MSSIAILPEAARQHQATLAATILAGILANPKVDLGVLEEEDWQELVGNAVTASADILGCVHGE